MKKVLTIRTSAIVDNFYICSLRLKISGEYNPKFTYADAIVTFPLTGRLPHINSDRFTQKLFDRPLDRVSCEIVAQVPTSEKFLRLSAERQAPLHRKMLHSHAYSAYGSARRFFVQLFYILLFFVRNVRHKRGAQLQHFMLKSLPHAFARQFSYFSFEFGRDNHNVSSIASAPIKLQYIYIYISTS